MSKSNVTKIKVLRLTETELLILIAALDVAMATEQVKGNQTYSDMFSLLFEKLLKERDRK